MYQQLTIVGYLGRDPEMRFTGSGTPVTSLDVAVTRTWTNDQGVKQEETTWFRVTAWNKQAETCAQYLKKGSQVLVTGTVKAHAYTGRDGQPGQAWKSKRILFAFLADRVQVPGMGKRCPDRVPVSRKTQYLFNV